MSLYRNLDQSDVALIELVKRSPEIYDHDNPTFRLVQSKEEAWDEIAKDLCTTKEDVKRRWTNFRDRYTRELKNIRLHPEKETRKNELFQLMDFLRGFVRRRSRRYNIDITRLKQQNEADMTTNMDDTMTDNNNEEEDDSSAVENQNNAEMDTNVYPEFVEVDENVTYDDFTDHHSVETVISNSSSMEKPIIPMNLPLVTTTNTYEVTLEQQQQQQQQQHQQIQQQRQQRTYKLQKPKQQRKHHQQTQQQPQQQKHTFYQLPKLEQTTDITAPTVTNCANNATLEGRIVQETEDDYFCKTMAMYLKQLSRRHKIKAQIEMFQILEKYIDLEEQVEEQVEEHVLSESPKKRRT